MWIQIFRGLISQIDFSGSNIRNSDLYGTSFWDANLSGADFSSTELTDYTYFNRANISLANFGNISAKNIPKNFGPKKTEGHVVHIHVKDKPYKVFRDDLFYYSWTWSDMPASIPSNYKAPLACDPEQKHISDKGRGVIPAKCSSQLLKRCKIDETDQIKEICLKASINSAPARSKN